MIFLLTLTVFGLIVAVVLLYGRTVRLEVRMQAIEQGPPDRAPVAETPDPEPAAEPPIAVAPPEPLVPRGPARIAYATPPGAARSAPVDPVAPTPFAVPPAAPASPPAAPLAGFENLVGGRLPIWIGGAALVLAAFFLVRYSIENGLLGPAARATLAAIFGIVLIAASEAARRFPAAADDPRVGQALAGAGIASLYGTLYMAGELYGLIGGLAAFVLMLLVTAGALALSLRHGPPTAIMGLIGGFAAPLVTGYSDSNLVPLLIYLALFTAALFGLAIARGWAWLALAAGGAGFAWSAWLIAAIDGSAANAIGPFILVLAIGATLALPRVEGGGAFALPRLSTATPTLSLAPLLLGLVQLVMLAPRLDFGPLAWGLYALLAAATVFLAVRDERLLPAAGAALALVLVMLALGLANNAASAPAAALAFAVLLSATGQALMTRVDGRRTWMLFALGGSAGVFLIARALTRAPVGDTGWALLALAAAACCALVAWRSRDPADDAIGHVAAPLLAALLVAIGLGPLIAAGWVPALLAGVMLALAAWARFVDSRALFVLPAIAFAAALIGATGPGMAYAALVMTSLTGNHLPYALLPSLADALRQLALPALAALGLLASDPRQFGRARLPVAIAVAAVAAMVAYHFAKLPLAIASEDRFVGLGFVERAVLTHALFAAAFVLARRPAWHPLAPAIAALALARIGWFDLGVLNPLLVEQRVGAIPLFNAAVLHAAVTALWLWLFARTFPAPMLWRRLSLAAVLLASLAVVRQATHGTDLTGAFGQAETWLYSAAMLAVALVWLVHGIRSGARDLRITGLALLTLVTVKVFLIDAAALGGLLRILSFLGLGLALIAIGWAYGRVLRRPAA